MSGREGPDLLIQPGHYKKQETEAQGHLRHWPDTGLQPRLVSSAPLL